MIIRSLLFLCISVLLFSCNKNQSKELKFEPQENLFLAKQFPDFAPNYAAMERALMDAKYQSESGQRTAGSWEAQGPSNIGARINTIAMHPSDKKIILAGFADGGLWRTSDGGETWNTIFENEITQAIGSICYDPVNPSTIYVGTGDPNVSGYPRVGGGMYKSTDSGLTWKYTGLKEANIISKVAIHKNNPNVIFASAMGIPFFKNSDKGVYKSIDGGANWNKVLFINDSTGISDVVLHPNNENILYAIGWNRVRSNKKNLVAGPDAKIWKSTDSGNNWNVLSEGLPNGEYTRLGLAISESNPNVLYVQYTDKSDLELESIYKSTDGGSSWDLHSNVGENGLPSGPLGGFGWYFGKLRVNPKNENDLFLLGVGLWRYNPTSERWEDADNGINVGVHADKHDLIFRDDEIYLATDGGLYKAPLSNLTAWEDIEDIPTTQFYRTAFDPHRKGLYWGGAQDNGTSAGKIEDINQWERYYGGDGFQMAFHPTDDQILWAESQRGNIVVSRNGGSSWSSATSGLEGSRHWDMQYIISSHNPDVMYTGTDKFYKNESGVEEQWLPISPVLVNPNSNSVIRQFTTLSESPVDPNVLYCGTSDGMVWNTKDGGSNWNQITNGLPLRYVSSIKASPSRKNRVFVTLTGYKDNDNFGHIYQSNDNGSNWVDVSGNLPSFAINDVYVYPDGKDQTLFVATDAGIYVTTNAGAKWDRMGNNMPFIPVFDLDYDPNFNKLIAATFARGIQTFDLGQIGINVTTSTVDVKETTITAVPNITNDLLSLTNVSEMEAVGIFNQEGKIVGQQKGNSVDLSNLSNGIYFLKVREKVVKVVKI